MVKLICHPVGERQWSIVSNPIFEKPHAEHYAAEMLENCFVEHVEWINSGIVYRLVRQHILRAYGISEGDDRP